MAEETGKIDPHMDFLGAVRQGLETLTSTGLFNLRRLKKNASVRAVLTTHAGIEVEFLRDRMNGVYCNLVIKTLRVPTIPDQYRTFEASDVFEALGLDSPPPLGRVDDGEEGFIDMINTYSKAILDNWPTLATAFEGHGGPQTAKDVARYKRIRDIKDLVRPLRDDSLLSITDLHFDDETERVDMVVLKSSVGIGIRLWYDGPVSKGTLHLEGEPSTYYRLDNVFHAIGVDSIKWSNDTIFGLVDDTVKALKDNLPAIRKAFDDEHRAETPARMRRSEEDQMFEKT